MSKDPGIGTCWCAGERRPGQLDTGRRTRVREVGVRADGVGPLSGFLRRKAPLVL